MNAIAQSTQSEFADFDLQQLLLTVRRMAGAAWSYRWLALAVAWLVSLAGWSYVSILPNTYGASSVVYVDTDSVIRPLLKGLSVESDVMNEVAVMTQAIVSRPNIDAVAREINLDVESNSPAEYEQKLLSLEERIDISRDRQGLYSISFQDTDRLRALKVVKSLLDSFVNDSLGESADDSAMAEKTLMEEIKDYENRLTEAENRLTEFKQRNVGMMPGERGDYYQQLQSALAELSSINQQLRIEKRKRDSLERQLVGEEPVFGLMTPVMGGAAMQGAGSRYDGEIAALEVRIAELLMEYTENHPEVARIQSRIDQLKERRAQEAPVSIGPEAPVASSPLDLNPVYQNMKIQLSNVQVEFARLEALRTEWDSEVKRLENLVDVIPQIEAELGRLNRDYDVVQARYKAMLERWENLQTSKRVGTGSDRISFRVIEPPYAPQKPDGPPRVLMISAVFIVALGGGLALAVLLSLLRPVYRSAQDFGNLGIPVLGVVSITISPTMLRDASRRNFLFLCCSVALPCLLLVFTAFAGPISEVLRAIAIV